MITPVDLLDFALQQVVQQDAQGAGNEASARRSISAAYYALFHEIAQSGAALLQAPEAVRKELAESYNHRALSVAAKTLQRLPAAQRPDPRLFVIAGSYERLREAREKADYDLTATMTWAEADELVQEALYASNLLREIRSQPVAAEFLLAPLIQKRARRG